MNEKSCVTLESRIILLSFFSIYANMKAYYLIHHHHSGDTSSAIPLGLQAVERMMCTFQIAQVAQAANSMLQKMIE